MTAPHLLQSLVEFPDDVIADYDTADKDNPEVLALLLVAMDDCRGALLDLRKRIANDLILVAGSKIVHTDVADVEIKKQTRRTGWDHDRLISAVVARVMDEPETLYDPESGELLPYAVIGERVAARLRDCVSVGAGKVTGLRRIGLDPGAFCNEEPDGYGVKVTKL